MILSDSDFAERSGMQIVCLLVCLFVSRENGFCWMLMTGQSAETVNTTAAKALHKFSPSLLPKCRKLLIHKCRLCLVDFLNASKVALGQMCMFVVHVLN